MGSFHWLHGRGLNPDAIISRSHSNAATLLPPNKLARPTLMAGRLLVRILWHNVVCQQE